MKKPLDSRTAAKILLSAIIIAAAISTSYPYRRTTKTVEITGVMDGDTFKATLDGKTPSIRLKHVDTPETSGYNTPREFKGLEQSDWRCLEDYGHRAKEFTGKMLGDRVSITYREGLIVVERGSYGRMLAQVKLGNTTLGEKLVRKGLARSYTDRYTELESRARRHNRGLWSCS
ncbi:MAG: thermonuclease family protein [Candidatus Nanohaloarchaea archaeon]